jgi:hypothetical protein
MTDRTPIDTTNLDRYGHSALPWSRPRHLLASSTTVPPPWQLYRFTFRRAFGVATAEPHGATRGRFDR